MFAHVSVSPTASKYSYMIYFGLERLYIGVLCCVSI